MPRFARILVPLCMVGALAGCYGGYYDDGGYYGSSYGYPSYGYSSYSYPSYSYGYAPSYSVGFSYYGGGYDGGNRWNRGWRHSDWDGGWHNGGHRWQWTGNNGGWSHSHQ